MRGLGAGAGSHGASGGCALGWCVAIRTDQLGFCLQLESLCSWPAQLRTHPQLPPLLPEKPQPAGSKDLGLPKGPSHG